MSPRGFNLEAEDGVERQLEFQCECPVLMKSKVEEDWTSPCQEVPRLKKRNPLEIQCGDHLCRQRPTCGLKIEWSRSFPLVFCGFLKFPHHAQKAAIEFTRTEARGRDVDGHKQPFPQSPEIAPTCRNKMEDPTSGHIRASSNCTPSRDRPGITAAKTRPRRAPLGWLQLHGCWDGWIDRPNSREFSSDPRCHQKHPFLLRDAAPFLSGMCQ